VGERSSTALLFVRLAIGRDMSNTDKKTIGFVSLGCPKALVDSERILTQLKMDGYDIVPSYEDAQLVVVNTCGFIDSAKQESLDAIGEALSENRPGYCHRLYGQRS
jgi:tRNA A37 methylthiotransferase MiaB